MGGRYLHTFNIRSDLMASTNRTENLGLSQWGEEDGFFREDLNADFRKIDGAVKRVKLFDVTVSATTTLVRLDFEGVDSDDFLELELHFDTSAFVESMYMRMNEVASPLYHTADKTVNNSFLQTKGNVSRISISRSKLVHSTDGGMFGEYMYKSHFPKVKTIELYPRSEERFYFAEGDTITVWGVLK